MPDVELRRLREGDDLRPVAGLMERYGATLAPGPRLVVTRAFERFPLEFLPPDGAFIVAGPAEATPIGCVGYRRVASIGDCEMKRLFVVPEWRGAGLGRRLALEAVRAATAAGYRRMVLGTFPDMVAAAAIYGTLGFCAADPIPEAKTTGLIWFGRDLSPGSIPPL